MKIGIVGSEGKKFTPKTEALAKARIRDLLKQGDTVVSGKCHLGGIDVWAAEIGREMGLQVREFPPAKLQWSGGYRERNIQIAEFSDMVVCITLRQLPIEYSGMTFEQCYHCGTTDHVKSGGCWTTKYARKLGKPTQTIVI